MRDERGFTLIELAIVIVIIGILLGAVLKGQDLIQNARMKKLTTEVRKWEVALWTCNDRLGRFPGDSDNDGLIDSDPTGDSCVSSLAQRPTGHSITLGSYTFYIYAGNDGNNRNVLAICGQSNCQNLTSGDPTYQDFLQNLDASIDGEVSATAGAVRAGTATVSSSVITATSTATGWTSTTGAALYYFDRLP